MKPSVKTHIFRYATNLSEQYSIKIELLHEFPKFQVVVQNQQLDFFEQKVK